MRRTFDLDDVRAHVGQHERAGGARHNVREVEHLQSGQWTHRFLATVA
jgi:hypothetical protein